MNARALLLSLWLPACGGPAPEETDDPSAETDTPVDTDTSAPVVCGDIPPDLCDANPACRTIKGFPVVEDPSDGDGYCVDKEGLPRRIGCISKEVECDGAQVRWSRPPGAPSTVCMRVLGSCAPRDYVDCDPALEVDEECVAE